MRLLWSWQRYEYLTGSRIICKTPGFLVSAKMTGTVAATSTVALHDGESANEGKILDLTALVKGCDEFTPSLPIPFNRGLYAALGVTAASLTVVIITRRE
jgi:hypothetical protein